MIEDGIGYCAPFRSLRLTPAPSACRRGSNGEAEARIPLKINIFLSSQPTQQYSSYKQKQSAEGAFFGGGRWDWLLRSLSVAPFNAYPSACRRGTSKPSQEVVIQLFCFHYHSYKQVCRVIIKTKGVDFSTPSCFVFGVEDGARTHDLRNHNPLL